MNSINFSKQLRQSMQHARDASNRALRSLCCRSIDTIDTPYNNNTPDLPLSDISKQLSSSSTPSSISQIPYQTISGNTPHYSEDSVGTSIRQNLDIQNNAATTIQPVYRGHKVRKGLAQNQNDILLATLDTRVNEEHEEENSVRQHAVPQTHNSDGLNLEKTLCGSNIIEPQDIKEIQNENATKIQRLFRGNLVRNAIRQKNKAIDWVYLTFTDPTELLFKISDTPSTVPEDLSLPLVLKSLIKDFDVDVNAKYPLLKFTPLHMAICYGHLELANLLIEHEADVNAKNTQGETPLHLAICYGHLELANLLIKHGADVNAKNKRRDTSSSPQKHSGCPALN